MLNVLNGLAREADGLLERIGEGDATRDELERLNLSFQSMNLLVGKGQRGR